MSSKFHCRVAAISAIALLGLFLAGCGDNGASLEARSDGRTADDLSRESMLVASLGEKYDVEVPAFISPTTTRGRSRTAPATLLWPQGDVRLEGLSAFAIEVTEDYEGDARLEFRKGRKILHSEPFDPDQLTTVSHLPPEVMDELSSGDRLTWGLWFEGRKKPVTAKVKVVRHPRADRKIQKLREDERLQKEPAPAMDLLIAQSLQNYRLYSEALVTYLDIAQNHPNTMDSYRGILTTLRRVDGEDTRLAAIVSPFVGGRGQTGTLAARPRPGQGVASLGAALPNPIPPTGGPATSPSGSRGSATRPLQPGDGVQPGLRQAGVDNDNAQPDPNTPAPAGRSEPADPSAPAGTGGDRARLLAQFDEFRHQHEAATRACEDLEERANDAEVNAANQRSEADLSRTEAETARSEASEAEKRAEQDPSSENMEAAAQARVAADDASRRATEAEHARHESEKLATELRGAADDAAREAAESKARMESAQSALQAMGIQPVPAAPTGAPEADEPSAPVSEREQELRELHEQSLAQVESAKADVSRARQELESLSEQASNGDQDAEGSLRVAREALDTAVRVLEEKQRAADEALQSWGGKPRE